jgi:hypothetical protein
MSAKRDHPLGAGPRRDERRRGGHRIGRVRLPAKPIAPGSLATFAMADELPAAPAGVRIVPLD